MQLVTLVMQKVTQGILAIRAFIIINNLSYT